MSGTDHRKRLVAILAADVAGYSRLMAADESATVATLDAARAVFRTQIEANQGRVIDMAGDSVLAVFEIATGAVTAALTVQQELNASSNAVPEDRRMRFRIGVHLGDVIEKADGTVYGDGVNIAARLEGLAEPGGIAVSDAVRGSVKNRVNAAFADLGAQTVKNIAEPVRAHRVLMDPETAATDASPIPAIRRKRKWIAGAGLAVVLVGGAIAWNFYFHPLQIGPAPVEKTASPVPGKPSIAVLPFTNLSGDKEQEYFADGMTDDLITDLSNISGLFVIARNSVFTYKGKTANVEKVAKELGVRYVLQGSVRRAGDQVRINTQLIDTMTGGHLWAERFDRRLKNIFSLQDTITGKVVQALELRLTKTERDRRDREPRTDSTEAYDLVLHARELMTRFDREAASEARKLLNRAIELDPKYAEAHSLLGLYYFDGWRLWGESQDDNLARALDLSRAAIKLSPLDPSPHVLLAQIHQFRREFDAANREADAALALEPKDAVTLANLGSMLRYAHRPKEAADVVERAIRLDPYHPPYYLEWLGDAYLFLGRLNDCIKAVERGMALDPNFVALHVVAAKCHAANGDEEKAREQGSEVLRINPGFTLRAFASYVPFSDKGDLQHNVEMLRKAGLPE